MYRNQFPAIQQNEGERVFFDNASTTQLCKKALSTYHNLGNSFQTNIARGIYREAEQTTNLYEQARLDIANCLNVSSNEIIFNKGTTDGLNTIAKQLLQTLDRNSTVVISESEHHSNYIPWIQLAKHYSLKIEILKTELDGKIKLSELKKFSLASVLALTHCSNVTGLITDIDLIKNWCKQNNVILVLDGSQMMQHHIPDLSILGADVYCFSSHKLFSTGGFGVSYINKNIQSFIEPVHWGGGIVESVSGTDFTWVKSPLCFEAGTPAFLAAQSLATSMKWLKSIDNSTLGNHQNDLLTYTHKKLLSYNFIEYIDFGVKNRHAIFPFNFKQLHCHDLSQILEQNGFCLRAGHHCAKPLLKAFNMSSCLRLSLTIYNTIEELEQFFQVLEATNEQTKHW